MKTLQQVSDWFLTFKVDKLPVQKKRATHVYTSDRVLQNKIINEDENLRESSTNLVYNYLMLNSIQYNFFNVFIVEKELFLNDYDGYENDTLDGVIASLCSVEINGTVNIHIFKVVNRCIVREVYVGYLPESVVRDLNFLLLFSMKNLTEQNCKKVFSGKRGINYDMLYHDSTVNIKVYNDYLNINVLKLIIL